MTTYYVDPVAGDNGDDGLTSGNAWSTLAFTNANISAGDTVNMMDGHFAENLSATTTGSVGNIITWQAVNSRLCSIQAQIVANGQEYQTFDGIKYLGDGTADASIRGSGNAAGLNNITWNDIEVFAARQKGLYILPSGAAQTIASWADTLIIQNSLFDQCQGCIFLYAQNSSILNNELRDMRHQGTNQDMDYMRPNGRNNLVKRNWCHGTDVANVNGSHVDCIQILHNSGEIIDGLTIEENFFEVIVQGIFMTHRNKNISAIDDITIQNNVFIVPLAGFNAPAQGISGDIAMMTFYGITNLDINHNHLIARRDTKCTQMRFHNSKDGGGKICSGTCKDNTFVRGSDNSPFPAGIQNVVMTGNISKDLDSGIAADFNSGLAIDPQIIDSAGDGYDALGTFLDADATWRPVVSTSRSLNAASDGGDLGAEIAVSGAGPPADTTPPVITLVGSASIQIPDTDASYTDAGATCSDNLDGELVMTAGVHDTDGVTANLGTPGVYTYDWDRSDAAANPATQVTRTVTITATNPATVYEVTIRLAV